MAALRAHLLALVALVIVAPTAAAAIELAVSPASMTLERGASPTVRLVLQGVEDRGGAFDLFVSSESAIVEFPPEEQRQGILVLPGTVSIEWTPRVRMLRGLDDGPHEVVFRLIERPGPPDPRTLEAVLTFELASASASASVPATPAPTTGTRWVGIAGLSLVLLYALYRVAPAMVALYWRTRRDRLLEHTVRSAMVDAVRADPGITPAELQRRLAIADGQLDHHLRRLVAAGLVQKVAADGARRLYLAGTAVDPGDPLAERIRAALREGAAPARVVAERVGVSPQHARYYLEKLHAAGALERRLIGARRVYGLREHATRADGD